MEQRDAPQESLQHSCASPSHTHTNGELRPEPLDGDVHACSYGQADLRLKPSRNRANCRCSACHERDEPPHGPLEAPAAPRCLRLPETPSEPIVMRADASARPAPLPPGCECALQAGERPRARRRERRPGRPRAAPLCISSCSWSSSAPGFLVGAHRPQRAGQRARPGDGAPHLRGHHAGPDDRQCALRLHRPGDTSLEGVVKQLAASVHTDPLHPRSRRHGRGRLRRGRRSWRTRRAPRRLLPRSGRGQGSASLCALS